jgi:peptidoglycan hydrolase CwlO-like protein
MVKISKSSLVILLIIIALFFMAGYIIQEKVGNDTLINLLEQQNGEIAKLSRKLNRMQNDLDSLRGKLDNTGNKINL